VYEGYTLCNLRRRCELTNEETAAKLADVAAARYAEVRGLPAGTPNTSEHDGRRATASRSDGCHRLRVAGFLCRLPALFDLRERTKGVSSFKKCLP